MVGATIGGGVGRFSGRFGLIIDALVSVRIVTADGQLLHVSKTSHPDLFWGIRGAGGNFGIITSATYALKKLADNPALDHGNMVNADFIIPAEMSGKYFDILQSFNHSIPAGLAVGSIIMYNDKSDTVCSSITIVAPLSVLYEDFLISMSGSNLGELGIHRLRG